jgi:F-type H+-transporting ATPase subunit epsilon
MNAMRLRILTPTEVLADLPVSRVVAEAPNGFFCLLPRHVDFVTALVPGILAYTDETGAELLAAVDEGILVKRAADVLVSVYQGVRGTGADALQGELRRMAERIDGEERLARTGLARLEAGTLRHLLELEDRGHG